jgi:hypothetical protein
MADAVSAKAMAGFTRVARRDSTATVHAREMRLAAAAAMLVAAAVGGLAGCATPVYNPATNEPLSAATPPNMGARTDFMRENSIVLSLSGGGLRAAAFAHGVLTALESVKTDDLVNRSLVKIRIEDIPEGHLVMAMAAVFRTDRPPGPAGRWLIERLKSR